MATEPKKASSTSQQEKKDDNDAEELEEFYRNYVQNAFIVVRDHFPVKIKELEKLKKEFNWSLVTSLKSNTEWVKAFTRTYFDGASGGKSPQQHLPAHCIAYSNMKPSLFDAYSDSKGAMIETNDAVHQMITRIKPYVAELVDHSLQLTFALQLLEPKMQEGNNFGVEVQYKALKVANDAYTGAKTFQDSLKSYYSSRDTALQSVTSYPHIEDQQAALAELERSFVYTLCRGVDELYNTYVGILDLVSKNIMKILLPRDDRNVKQKTAAK